VDQLLAEKSSPTENNALDLTLYEKGRLAQNQPNPFHQNTTINYFVPIATKDAKERLKNNL
jgi:hypothetical protein